MKTLKEALASVVASKPRITIDAIKPNGNVTFHVKLKSLGLNKEDCSNPAIWTRFFANFVGELLVRENVSKFANILTELDSGLYSKLVAVSTHVDFGMVPEKNHTILTFGMHMNFVYVIVTEGQRQGMEDINEISGCEDFFDEFANARDSKKQ